MDRRIASHPLRAIVLLLFLILLSSGVIAQDATPIAIGQNVPGEITAETGTVRFALAANAGDTATIQVLGFAPGFAPRFRVFNPSDVEILAVANPNGLATVSGSASFTDAGTYTIEVTGENGTTGQFLLSLTSGQPLPPPISLAAGQTLDGIMDSETPILVYEFSASPIEALLLSITSNLPDAGPAIVLRNETTDATLATSDSHLTAIAYRLATGTSVYQLELHLSGEAMEIPFSVCLESIRLPAGCFADLSVESSGTTGSDSDSGSGGLFGLLTPLPADQTATTVPAAPVETACTVTSATGGGINVRSGPGTGFGIVGSLSAGQSYPVVGQITGGSWYQVSANGSLGWVAGAVVQTQGACNTIPVVTAPAAPPVVPTTAPAAPPAVPTTAVPPPAVPTTAVPPPPAPSGPTATDLPPITPGNNILEGPGIGGGQADLLVAAVSRSAPNEQVTMRVFANVSNSGDGYAGPFLVTICSEGECGTVTVDGLAAGASLQVSRAFASNPEAEHFSATADSGNSVAESNETNNSLYY